MRYLIKKFASLIIISSMLCTSYTSYSAHFFDSKFVVGVALGFVGSIGASYMWNMFNQTSSTATPIERRCLSGAVDQHGNRYFAWYGNLVLLGKSPVFYEFDQNEEAYKPATNMSFSDYMHNALIRTVRVQ